MNLKYGIKVKKQDRAMLDIGTKRLMDHISNYTFDDIKRMRVDDYLVHKKFIENGQYFIIFKTAVVKQQLRLLCHITEDEVTVVDFYVKKDSRYKYYNDFKTLASTYSSTIC